MKKIAFLALFIPAVAYAVIPKCSVFCPVVGPCITCCPNQPCTIMGSIDAHSLTIHPELF